jgi:membrane protein implicated in regulation of membrane protease activity
MKTETFIKIYIFIVSFITGLLLTSGLIHLGLVEWWESLLTFVVVILNTYLVYQKFKDLRKKD